MRPVEPRIALVEDTLSVLGGAERTLSAVLELYPEAPIFTVTYNQDVYRGTLFEGRDIRTSFIDRLPGKRLHYKLYAPFFPLAVERFDLRQFDIIISLSYAFAHGVLPLPGQLHISYTHTPLRYLWHAYHDFIHNPQRAGVKSLILSSVLHYLRLWDQAAAGRVDRFYAISRWVAQGVWRSYRRQAEVIYPPVEVDRFTPGAERDSFYITVGRLSLNKNLEIMMDAFTRLGLPLLVVGDGPERSKLTRRAGDNIRFTGRLPDVEVARLLGRAKAFIFSAEDDFGIAPVEAQAAGCPVIAYGRGGALETVIEGETGFFFMEPEAESLAQVVDGFERCQVNLDSRRIHQNALRFNKERFQDEFRTMVAREWADHNHFTQAEIPILSYTRS